MVNQNSTDLGIPNQFRLNSSRFSLAAALPLVQAGTSLAFLAPKLVQAAVEGRLPRSIGVTRLRDAPAEWSRQYAMLGLSNRFMAVLKRIWGRCQERV